MPSSPIKNQIPHSVLPIPTFEEFTIAPPPPSTTEVSSIPTVEESSVVPPSSPATGTPLLTYHRRLRLPSGPTGSRPAPDPAPAADPAPSTPIALRKGGGATTGAVDGGVGVTESPKDATSSASEISK
uniref:Eukaryotic translation initiation factor 3 subunit F-like n=1 Tax=Nicotiana tabacum TaxID=4097 RepID=A0A1S3ZQH0_TOBAC|nr:PREDICTED: eukaryotic translation initiation factor 3 subunit F-like [Nicotiana tabacum]